MSATSAADVLDLIAARIVAQPLNQGVGDETAWRQQPTIDTESPSFAWSHGTFAIVPGDQAYLERRRDVTRTRGDFGVVVLMHAREGHPDHLDDLRRALRAIEDLRAAIKGDAQGVELDVTTCGLTGYAPDRGLFILGLVVQATYDSRG